MESACCVPLVPEGGSMFLMLFFSWATQSEVLEDSCRGSARFHSPIGAGSSVLHLACRFLWDCTAWSGDTSASVACK